MTVSWLFNIRRRLIQAILLFALLPMGMAMAQQDTASASAQVDVTIAAQDAGDALRQFAIISDIEILFPAELVSGISTNAVNGRFSPEAALHRMLRGTGLTYRAVGPDTYVVEEGQLPPDPIASNTVAGQNTIGQRRPGIEEIIVTGQKREERIQDVPIAISAFSAEDLEAQKLEGGFDLLKAIPNVTFTKTNFTGYNFQIRGIGTQAVSATTDPGVAVALNSTGLIHNRLFEQEYVDVERVEVLRGPQGTLYGRNATAGVINVITKKPELNVFTGMIKGEIGNYDTNRLRGHVNIPLIDDVLAARLAYASTDRSGYDYNSVTDNQINGRDLWTGRVTLGFQPTERIRADLVWEHFEEDDDRARTSKQLCHRDPGPEFVGETSVIETNAGGDDPAGEKFKQLLGPAKFSQGCLPGSLFDEEAFGTPNGLALPFVFAPLSLGGDCGSGCTSLFPIVGGGGSIIELKDPYGGLMQSRDLRTIASFRDPHYRAEADIFQLNVDFDITDALTLTSQTAWNEDEVFSFQDFNRFNSLPIFTNTSEFPSSNPYRNIAPGGVFCDPQVGCSNTLAGFDVSQASSEQFSQELRITSAFSGPVNFSLGANYTTFETINDYYVFYNLISALALMPPINSVNSNSISGTADISKCWIGAPSNFIFGGAELDPPLPADAPNAYCPYIDPDPVAFDENFDGDGHNYFRSKNPYELESWAGFGELYWNITDALKVTAGLRYTKDKKDFTLVPSQVLLAPGLVGGGTVSRGYPEAGEINQEWGEWTGRLGIDWKPAPVFDWQDETMLYAFFSRGYKAGGANPPTPGFATYEQTLELIQSDGADFFSIFLFTNQGEPVLELTAVDYGPTFDAEFVNAFEVGAKNTLFGGALIVNTTAFYYDYQDYQVSQIKDRTAVNENFDAEVWGLELETVFSPSLNWQFLANIGYLQTEIAEGETSIDIINRTQGNPNYTLVKPWAQLPSNCVVPTPVVESALDRQANVFAICGGVNSVIGRITDIPDPNFEGAPYDLANYPELNGGAGLRADLGGNELPNAPHFTANIGAQYSRDVLGGDWRLTFRTDAYWQAKSYHRVYNLEPYDRLQSWSNFNITVNLGSENLGWEGEFYVKNLLDKTPITGAFLNSDDTGLTTNVFVLDPRLVGFSLRKEF